MTEKEVIDIVRNQVNIACLIILAWISLVAFFLLKDYEISWMFLIAVLIFTFGAMLLQRDENKQIEALN